MAVTNLHDHNAKLYQKTGIADSYQGAPLLTQVEVIALLKYQPAFASRDVLDIGVGTGRTTTYLAPLAHHYQAVDYSPAMVSRFRESFPGTQVMLADMTDLHGLQDATFDFVLASNNVFDAVDHQDRLRTLGEIHRLLRPAGMLVFSSHNRHVDHAAHWPTLPLSRNPVTQLQCILHWGIASINHARLKHSQSFTPDYAIINDDAHDCALLHYYIGPNEQRRQLASMGFRVVEVLDALGRTVAEGERAVHSRSLVYVTERAGPD